LIAWGHHGAWDYTPRQIAGFHNFASKRQKQEVARDLSIMASASRGDPKELKKQIRDLQKP
jgi:hypothetical protein